MEHGVPGAGNQRPALSWPAVGRRAAAIPVTAGVGTHKPDGGLPVAQQFKDQGGEVQAVAAAASGLAVL